MATAVDTPRRDGDPAARAPRSDAFDVARIQSSILFGPDERPPAGLRVLDLGCGDGATVLGWAALGADAFGCDFGAPAARAPQRLFAEGRVSEIETSPRYRLPYADGTFDCVVSNQVFEHVADYAGTIRECRRVLKDDGVALHIFPARLVPIEPHVYTPFGGALQSRSWIGLWTLLGVRTRKLARASWREATDATHRYLSENTNYLSGREILSEFGDAFGSVAYAERAFLHSSPNRRGRALARAARVAPPLYRLYRVFWSRVVLCRSPKPLAGGGE